MYAGAPGSARPSVLPQSENDKKAQKGANLADKYAPACQPTNWERDNHPAYEDLDPAIRDFVRKRYRHWAPKVSWIYRLWFHLINMNGHLAADWLVRSDKNSEEAVQADRKKRAVDYFWDGRSPAPAPACLLLTAHLLTHPTSCSQQTITTSPWRPSPTRAARPGIPTISAT